MSCMSPYSMPLCTILTKWPAPSLPIQAQQGVPSSTFAATSWKIAFTCGHALASPPGMMAGPSSAPSSPPETPEPMKRRPLSARYFVRRMVSGK
ncbi:MAG: hypothetical protein BWX70_03491 [Verrucomicrobia bacterium ADurb.Bin070]|nr:MAG: hypothetical protein BWX70_03491 [Verrucomicrobia bacterium ADurb.Bin070]